MPNKSKERRMDTITNEALRDEVKRLRAAIDRITRKWARASFDETIIAPLPEIEAERRLFGLPDFTATEIAEFNP